MEFVREADRPAGTQSATGIVRMTRGDSTPLVDASGAAVTSRSIYIGASAGNVRLLMADGTSPIVPVLANSRHPWQATQLYDSGTTAGMDVYAEL